MTCRYPYVTLYFSMDIQQFISKYDKSDIASFEYSEILADIHDSVVGTPFPIVSLFDGELIERIRNNYNGEIFRKQEEVSFRTDLQNITDYGRVNKPHQSNFYGTLMDDNLDFARITTVLETHPTLRIRSTKTTEQQIFTTSQWLARGKFRLLIVPFHTGAKSKRLRATAEHFTSAISFGFGVLSPKILEFLQFFSEHFGRGVSNHLNYKLTAAFGEVFMQDYELDGIIYPSIKSEFRTQNIVLNEKGMSKLELHKVGMFELFIHNDQVFIDSIAYAEDLGLRKDNFNWVQVERTPRETIDEKIGINRG